MDRLYGLMNTQQNWISGGEGGILVAWIHSSRLTDLINCTNSTIINQTATVQYTLSTPQQPQHTPHITLTIISTDHRSTFSLFRNCSTEALLHVQLNN